MGLLEVQNLRTYFFTRRGVVKAVDGVSFTIRQGECLGIVGESGSGKSMTLLSLLRLVPWPAARIVDGEIFLDGQNLLALNDNDMQKIRGKHISFISQDPNMSLNPVFTCGYQVEEPLCIHQGLRGGMLRQQAINMIKMVRLSDPPQRYRNFPHELSGGMRQRIVGAIALSCQPRLLLADEPTTALDTTVQAQYLKLLKELQSNSKLTLLYVSHSLPVISMMCDRVLVMYAGKIVEEAPTGALLATPAHPYTQALIAAIPWADKDVDRLVSIPGEPPELSNLPPGCAFAPRCGHVMDVCTEQYPAEVELGQDRRCSCWRLRGNG